MSYFTASLAQLIGQEPRKPDSEEISPKVREIHAYKKQHKISLAALEAERRANRESGQASRWLKRRWSVLIAAASMAQRSTSTRRTP